MNQMKQSILCVDSDEEILVDLKQHLEMVGYHVFTSNDGEQGLEIIKKERPNVIISEQQISSTSGRMFLRETRNILPDAMRILLTTQTDLDEITDAINIGSIHKFILKPWQSDTLLEMIQEGLQQQKLGIENRKLTLRLARQYKYLKETNASLQDELKQTKGELDNLIEEMDKANEQDEIFDDEEATETQLLEKAKLRVKQLYDEVQNLRQARDEYSETFATLNNIMEVTNPVVYTHSNRVGAYCSWLAEALELEKQTITDLNYAAILHDIGKLEIDQEILGKP
ncbi:TPA: response regulator, partial [Candidatus Poribacteria bacterium]|nr:response regulator [Candidatus Poribacteria bacterium]